MMNRKYNRTLLLKTVLLIVSFLVLFFTNSSNAQEGETLNWFPFKPTTDQSKSIIKMNDWLEAPAGKHGSIKMNGDQLQFEDGTPIKFWGVNISANDVFTNHENAETWSNTLSNYGVNAVRFHKFSQPGMEENTSTKLSKEKYERLDYFSSKLKEKGIYYGWSPIYGHRPKSGDSIKLLAYEELALANMNSHLDNSTIGLVNFAEDLQDLHIELILNLINHKNPYTGLKYVDDPALIFVEIQNEDNIFFATTEIMLEECPTYKKLLTNGFHQWLRKKYNNQDNLIENWGKEAFIWGKGVKKINWNLDNLNITPVTNHGIYDYEFKKASSNKLPLPVFLSDMATFLYELQEKYYKRASKAIRNSGYKGQIISSNWQAGSGITHYLNLYSDYQTGIIDRHNYYGGGIGHTLKQGVINNHAMVSKPGTGLLSTGMQQVANAPFSISEWLSLIPNEWTAEGAPIIAAYGMGLQGWDASFAFNSEFPFFTPTLEQPNKFWPGIYNVMSPTQLALYPALARMVYRNDVKEGDIISKRFVSLSDLKNGQLNFDEIIAQKGDVKEFSGTVPTEALGIGKVLVEFTDSTQKTNSPKLSNYWDTKNKIISSTTNQLHWDYADKGFFTINTPNTKGFVGFTSHKIIKLEDVTLQTETPFAVVLISSLNKNESIADAKRVLVTTMARANNSGMKYNTNKTKLLAVGKVPILLEPVQLEISFTNKEILKVIALDHVGNRTQQIIKSCGTNVTINGAKEKTLYYEIVFK